LLTFFILIGVTAQKIVRSTAEVFADLYQEYLPKVYRYISYRITDTHQAEDLTSIVFEKALTKFQSYSSEKAAFSTWIFSITRNTLIDYFRASHKVQTVQIEEAPPPSSREPSPEDELVKSEEFQKLQHCLSHLAAQEREILSLKFGGEMNNRQIARMTGLSESNVGVIIYRAVRKLRGEFDKGWEHG
jgi:RNA polymerase sigma factor (sigma-70 family)